MSYPTKLNMDEIYCQVERDGKRVNVCFSDMTAEERALKELFYSKENMAVVIEALCMTLRDIGERYGFIANDPERINEV